MDWKNIILKKEDQIVFVTLNRPEVYPPMQKTMGFARGAP
jgi:hypothetical protein